MTRQEMLHYFARVKEFAAREGYHDSLAHMQGIEDLYSMGA